MKPEDFGIDPKTKKHNQTLTRAENVFTGILWTDHIGSENATPANVLAVRFASELNEYEEMLSDADIVRRIKIMERSASGRSILDGWKRDVRLMHNHLLKKHDHIPILSRAGAGGGYFIAQNEEELNQFYGSFRKRGLEGLVKASRGKKAVLAEMVQQLSFDFELEDRTELEPVRPGSVVSMPAEVIDQFLERMLKEPERFSKDLRKLSDKFGHVLFDKHKHQALRRKVAELGRLLDL